MITLLFIFLGEEYENGAEFCQGQKFEVAEDNVACFDFDPNVFGCATVLHRNIFTTVGTAVFFLTCLLR